MYFNTQLRKLQEPISGLSLHSSGSVRVFTNKTPAGADSKERQLGG